MCFKKLKKYIENGVKRFSWYDISLVKGAVFFATLFLLTAWTAFRDFVLNFSWQIYFILFVLFSISPMMKFFK